MLSVRLVWGPVRGFCADGVLFSVSSSSVVTHSLFPVLTCTSSLWSIPLLCSWNVVGLSLRSAAPFKLCSCCLSTRSKGREESALQSSPAHCSHAGRQPKLFARLSSLPAQDNPRQQLGCGPAPADLGF